jgi:hypothetical protein
MNAFNLIMSIFLFSNGPEIMQSLGANSININPMLISVGLGIIPLAFSTIFFLVPLLRLPVVLAREKKRKEANKRKRLIKEIFKYYDIPLNKIKENISKGSEKLITEEELNKLMDKLVIELRGEKNLDDKGNIQYAFERIKDEFTEVKNLRKTLKMDGNLGNVVLEI